MPWQYEPEGFKLSDGRWYLPDFRIELVDGPLWVEVKPKGGESDLFVQFMYDLACDDAYTDEYEKFAGIILHDIPDPDGWRMIGSATVLAYVSMNNQQLLGKEKGTGYFVPVVLVTPSI